MGNHDVGRGMNAAAKVYWIARGPMEPTKEEALAILDAMAEDYRGADAEFDDYLLPDEPLGKLALIAFGPWNEEDDIKDAEEAGGHWYEKIYEPMKKRYRFCWSPASRKRERGSERKARVHR